MLWFLRALFLLILGSMLAVTSWAGARCPLSEIPPEVLTHPWFIATLVDAYWGFLTFYLWVAWKEQRFASRLLWFTAIVLLGNIAMAGYVLVELFRLRATAPLLDLLTLRRPGQFILPGLLTAAGVAVYCLS